MDENKHADVEEDMPSILFAVINFSYNCCGDNFRFNNLLYKYIRVRVYKKKLIIPQVIPTLIIDALAALLSIFSLFIPTTNLNIGFGFRNYYFLTLIIKLTESATPEPVYMDTGCLISLIDRHFFKECCPLIRINIIASPILIRGIGSNYHSTNEYMLLEIFLLGKREGKEGLAKIIREVYLVDRLKAKMLLGTDIIGPKIIDIIIFKKQVYIGSCKTTVPIDFKLRSRGVTYKPVIAN